MGGQIIVNRTHGGCDHCHVLSQQRKGTFADSKVIRQSRLGEGPFCPTSVNHVLFCTITVLWRKIALNSQKIPINHYSNKSHIKTCLNGRIYQGILQFWEWLQHNLPLPGICRLDVMSVEGMFYPRNATWKIYSMQKKAVYITEIMELQYLSRKCIGKTTW